MENSESKKAKAGNITYNVMIDRANKDGTYNMYLRITQNRKHKKLKLDIRLPKQKNFNKNAEYGKWIISHPQAKVWNDLIDREISKAKEHQRTLKDTGVLTAKNIIDKLTGNDSDSFFQYAEKRAQYFFESGGYRNYKKYKTFIAKLRAFTKGQDLPFNEITAELVTKFELYLRKQKNTRHPEFTLHNNTVARQLIVFKAIMNDAVKSGKIAKTENPISDLAINIEKTNKQKLSVDEVEALNGLELPENSTLRNHRNYFMFSFYCAGIRAGDLMLLKWCNITAEGRLEYQISKTMQKKSIKLLPYALDILKEYQTEKTNPHHFIFPLLSDAAPYAIANNEQERTTLPANIQKAMYDAINSKNVIINKGLKKLAQMAGINKPLSLHISRHSFADIARKKGISIYDIKNMLAHSSTKITEAYLSEFDSESMDESMERVFE
jgi:integrase/recombinase XerD